MCFKMVVVGCKGWVVVGCGGWMVVGGWLIGCADKERQRDRK